MYGIGTPDSRLKIRSGFGKCVSGNIILGTFPLWSMFPSCNNMMKLLNILINILIYKVMLFNCSNLANLHIYIFKKLKFKY